MNIRNFIRYHIIRPIINESIELLVVNGQSINSYSQCGEDLVIDALLQKDKGFYIDVGANDPVRFSNTKRFYDKGWQGFVIEPNPDLCQKFRDVRPNDTVWNIGIGIMANTLPFYNVSSNTLSSFNKEDAVRGCKEHGEKIINTISIEVKPLRDLPLPGRIDFMSIDTEGNELDVLRSHNWAIMPEIIVVEIQTNTNQIYNFLVDKGYDLVYKNNINGIFKMTTKRMENHSGEHNHTHNWSGCK
jgi:FkbM family methyltransferase